MSANIFLLKNEWNLKKCEKREKQKSAEGQNDHKY